MAAVFLLLVAGLLIYRVWGLPAPAAVTVSVPTDSFVPASAVPSVLSAAEPSAPVSPTVDFSTATADQLTAVPGIGPVLAERLIAYRDTYGPLSSLEELRDVPGIGDALYDTLTQYLYIP